MKQALMMVTALGFGMTQASATVESKVQAEFVANNSSNQYASNPYSNQATPLKNSSDAIAQKIQQLQSQSNGHAVETAEQVVVDQPIDIDSALDVHSQINQVESLVSQLDHKDDELSGLIEELAAKKANELKREQALTRKAFIAKEQQTTFKSHSYSAKSSRLSSSARPVVAARRAARTAHSRSRGLCARYVRKALQAAGYQFTPNASAYQYATRGTLRKAGFVKISNRSKPQIGDVVVISRSRAHPHGHIAIYDGRRWVSDFRQKNKSPYSRYYPYTTWRDSRYVNASSKGLYMATR